MGTAVGAVSSMVTVWWVLLTIVCAFLLGLRTGSTRPFTLGVVGLLASGVVALSVVPSWISLATGFVTVVVGAAVVPWFVGRFWYLSRRLVRTGWERAAQLEREQLLVADRARLRERTLIAQDMHDVLGHELTMIALSAGALQLAQGLAEPHRVAVQDIRARAAEAVDRLGEVIGVLRQETANGSDTHAVTGLVDKASAAGLAVRLRVEGEVTSVAPGIARAVYRVVQEALTNIGKHAPTATAEVRIRYATDETEVHVANGPGSGTAPARSDSAGSGLIGLDERVRLADGSLTYGPTANGFCVHARFPRPGQLPDEVGEPPGAPVHAVEDHRRARHRLHRTVVAAVLVPLVAGALLIGALRAWDVLTTRQSVLTADSYARLQIGQQRSAISGLLPEHQTARRPSTPEPQGSDISCEYYSMTADPFADRSGDGYRLCFRAGALITADSFAEEGIR
ncbi:sensor histidine kinase [Nocardia brasiliensis]|uniref:sensor histidine kinase n=1 Tax=Nocardia brasiliensis TaxID=37326 RepID=UPI00367197E8